VSTTVDVSASNVGGILPVAKGGTGTASPSLVAGANIASITGTWPNQTINATTQGGGGSSSLAVALGSSTIVTTLVSSPTAIVNFDRSQFSATLTGGATAFVSIAPSTTAVSGSTTLSSTHSVVMASASGGAITVTLPTAVGISGKIYRIKMTSSSSSTNTVTVATTSAQTIDGATTQVLTLQYTDIPVISDGSNWSIL